MSCDRCPEFREKGAAFCPFCGERLGNPLVAVRAPRRKYDVFFIAGLIAAIQGMLMMFVEILVGWGKLTYVLDGVAGSSYTLYYITPQIRDLVTVGDVGIMAIFVLELITVTACLGIMLYQAMRKVRENYGDVRVIENTAAYEMPITLGLLLLAEIAFMFLMIMAGVKLDGGGNTDMTPSLVFSLLHASVYEEILCRLLMLGLPCLIVALLLKRKDSPWWRYLFGGMKFEWWMVFFILFSAVMFGAAHLTNWGTWKFIPTFAFGLMAGYLYVKYGLHACIGAHFINDYLVSSQWAIGAPGFFMVGMIAVGLCSLPYLWRYYTRMRDTYRSYRVKKESEIKEAD